MSEDSDDSSCDSGCDEEYMEVKTDDKQRPQSAEETRSKENLK